MHSQKKIYKNGSTLVKFRILNHTLWISQAEAARQCTCACEYLSQAHRASVIINPYKNNSLLKARSTLTVPFCTHIVQVRSVHFIKKKSHSLPHGGWSQHLMVFTQKHCLNTTIVFPHTISFTTDLQSYHTISLARSVV